MEHIGWRRASRCLGTFVLLISGCGDGAKPAAAIRPVQMETVPEAEAPAIAVAANDARTRAPLDATPSPDGTRVYYLATTLDEQGEESAGVFAVAAVGGKGATPETLSTGDPLVTPVGITTSLDGTTLYVADTAASALFSLQSAGGTPSALSGTEGYQPAGLTVARRKQEERLFFTGRDPQRGAAGLFSVPASGGAVQLEASGELFAQPGGVVLSAVGDAFVVDMGEHTARVLRVHEGKTETFVSGIGVGFPAGITLTHDEHTLIVSGLDPNTRHDVVYFVDVASGKLSQLTQVVGAFSEAAGLHRAHDKDVFAWADSRANASGTVYLLTL